MTDTISGPEWDPIVKFWGNAYTFSADPDQHPDQPYAARRRDGTGTVRAATPAALLDAIKDDYARRPFARLATPGVIK